MLKNTPEDVAQFLYKGEGLNKTAIGEYLGERWVPGSSQCREVMWLDVYFGGGRKFGNKKDAAGDGIFCI